MAQPSQSTPTVAANIAGTRHQVNLRDYLNARVAPFLKKAITESLDASPEFPLQWLGENLIHQSMLYESNPDSTNIKARFLYKFEAPAPAAARPAVPDEASVQPPRSAAASETPVEAVPPTNGDAASAPVAAQDTQMTNHVNWDAEAVSEHPDDDSKDLEMAGTS